MIVTSSRRSAAQNRRRRTRRRPRRACGRISSSRSQARGPHADDRTFGRGHDAVDHLSIISAPANLAVRGQGRPPRLAPISCRRISATTAGHAFRASAAGPRPGIEATGLPSSALAPVSCVTPPPADSRSGARVRQAAGPARVRSETVPASDGADTAAGRDAMDGEIRTRPPRRPRTWIVRPRR